MNYTKDFRTWCETKYLIQSRPDNPPGYKEREIWWAQLGLNIGDEEDGKGTYFSRPVLIIRGFSRQLIWVLPLTSRPRQGKYYYTFVFQDKSSVAILSQLKAIDRRRLTTKIGVVDEMNFSKIRQRVRQLLL